MTRTLNRLAVCAVAGLALLTSACNGETGKATTGSNTPSDTASAAPTSSSGNAGLAKLKPCDLLTEAEVTSLGLKYPGEPDKVGTSDGCSWNVSGNGGLAAGIRPNQGLDDLNVEGAKKVSEIKVGKYKAQKIEAPQGALYGCIVAIAVTDSSTVEAVANLTGSSTDTAAACERASKAADMIAPKLP